MEISEAPKRECDHGLEDRAEVVARHRGAQERVVAGDADQAEADDQHAGNGAGPEGDA